MLTKIRLVSKAGNLIAYEAVPRFKDAPNIIEWCGRLFVLICAKPDVKWAPHTCQERDITTYMEAFSLSIPEPESTAKAMGSKHTEIP